VITGNAHKYPISAQCDILGIARSTYYKRRDNPDLLRIGNRRADTCLLLDLANRDIVGHGASWRKDAALVKSAFASKDANHYDVDIFHSERGSEFDNMTIDDLSDFFGIRRSLSRKSNPWDNAVAEATFKLYKAEFTYREHFNTIEELQVKLSDYVHWFNNVRIHSTLGYLTPAEFKEKGLMMNIKAVSSRLGHSSVGITLDLYAHAQREDDEQAAVIIGQIMAQPAPQMGQVVNL
jgi:transposase InsO family protein